MIRESSSRAPLRGYFGLQFVRRELTLYPTTRDLTINSGVHNYIAPPPLIRGLIVSECRGRWVVCGQVVQVSKA